MPVTTSLPRRGTPKPFPRQKQPRKPPPHPIPAAIALLPKHRRVPLPDHQIVHGEVPTGSGEQPGGQEAPKAEEHDRRPLVGAPGAPHQRHHLRSALPDPDRALSPGAVAGLEEGVPAWYPRSVGERGAWLLPGGLRSIQ